MIYTFDIIKVRVKKEPDTDVDMIARKMSFDTETLQYSYVHKSDDEMEEKVFQAVLEMLNSIAYPTTAEKIIVTEKEAAARYKQIESFIGYHVHRITID